jgi:hypothetical protein
MPKEGRNVTYVFKQGATDSMSEAVEVKVEH